MVIMQFDRYQGRDEYGRPFGYIGSDEDGGYNFTWLPSLEETLDSIEANCEDRPEYDWSGEARDYLKSELADDFDGQLAELAAQDARAE